MNRKRDQKKIIVIYTGDTDQISVTDIGVFFKDQEKSFEDPDQIAKVKKLIKENEFFEEVEV